MNKTTAEVAAPKKRFGLFSARPAEACGKLAALPAVDDPGHHHHRLQVRANVRHPDRFPEFQAQPGHHRQRMGGAVLVPAVF